MSLLASLVFALAALGTIAAVRVTVRQYRDAALANIAALANDTFGADGVSLSTIYGATGITPMLDKTFDFPACDLWKAYFLNGSGYG